MGWVGEDGPKPNDPFFFKKAGGSFCPRPFFIQGERERWRETESTCFFTMLGKRAAGETRPNAKARERVRDGEREKSVRAVPTKTI